MYSGNQGAGGTPVGGHCTAVLPGGENPSGVAQSGGQDDQVGHRSKRERERDEKERGRLLYTLYNNNTDNNRFFMF